MKDGFVKVEASPVKIRVADVEYNKAQIISKIRQSDANGVRLLVLPELCLTGYTCGDLFFQSVLLDGAKDALKEILEQTADTDTVAVIGLPMKNNGKIYNCAAVIHGGRLLGVVPKKHIPMYNEFYEGRQFAPGPEYSAIYLWDEPVFFGTDIIFAAENMPEFRLSVEICEDLWSHCPPSVSHAAAGATIIANPSASNETIGKYEYRHDMVKGLSARLLCGYVYSGSCEGESTTDMVFGGHCIVAENNAILDESKAFEYQPAVSELDLQRLEGERRHITTFPAEKQFSHQTTYGHTRIQQKCHAIERFAFKPLTKTSLTRFIPSLPFVPQDKNFRDQRCELIIAMQSEGLKKRIEHTGTKTVVVGLSGGLDSTLALLIMVSAMKKCGRDTKDIIAVTMPCFGTTSRTKNNAVSLAEALGVTLVEIDISESVRRHLTDIGHPESDHSVTYENAQARERTQVLMDIANKTGGMVVGTGDLSELALGWATYNGDHMSMYGVNASVPKTLIRHIVRYCADTSDSDILKSTLLDILDTPVSPELLPAENGVISQKTEDLVGPYELHDFFLYNGVRWGFPPKKVFRLAEYAFAGEYDRETIKKWMRVFYSRFFAQQFKRSCLPDGPKIGSVTLSPRGDWRMPSDASCALWLKEIDEME